MPQLKDMKRTAAEIAEDKREMEVGPATDEYPWGLRLRLEDETLDKLEMGMLPSLGDEVEVVARGKVTSVSEREDVEFGPDRSVEIQIQELGVGRAREDASDRLYPGSKPSEG